MRLTLHIGTPKTGTSTLQKWFTVNRAALRDQGVWYCESLFEPANRLISTVHKRFEGGDRHFIRNDIGSETEQGARRDQARRSLEDEVATARSAGCREFVISDEHLFSEIDRRKEIELVRDFVEGLFDQIVVTVGLRPQIDVVVSHGANGNYFRHPLNTDYFERITIGSRFYDYQTVLRPWETAFGIERIEIVPLTRHPTVVRYLIEKFSIDTGNLTAIERLNAALGLNAIAFVNALNPEGDTELAREYHNRLLRLASNPDDEKVSIGLPLARKVQKVFDASNAALAERYHGLTADDLQPDWTRYDKPSNLHLLDEPCLFSDELNGIFRRMAAIIGFERARSLSFSAANAAQAGRPEAAARQLKRAERHLAMAKLNGMNADVTKTLEHEIEQTKQIPVKRPGIFRWLAHKLGLSAG